MISREDVALALETAYGDSYSPEGRAQHERVAAAILALIQSESEVPVQRDERAEKLGEQLDAMVAEVNTSNRAIVRLEERVRKAEAAEDREASLADLLNSWARESGVAPCDRPEDSKGVADRLWAKLSLDLAAAREKAQNAEALAANLKRLENERAIELMHFKRDLATLRARVRELEDALEFARDVLIEEGLQDVVPATLRKIARTLLTTPTKEAMPFMLPAPKPATPIPPDPRDAVVKAAEALERAIRALCPTCRPDHVLDNGRVWVFCGAGRLSPGIPEEEVAAAIRALHAAEDRG